MRRGIVGRNRLIAAFPDDTAFLDDDSADRHFTCVRRLPRALECGAHESLVLHGENLTSTQPVHRVHPVHPVHSYRSNRLSGMNQIIATARYSASEIHEFTNDSPTARI